MSETILLQFGKSYGMKVRIVILLVLVGFLLAKSPVQAGDSFVTIVHPVRARKLWFDHSLAPLESQIRLSQERNLPTTWLLQYEALLDKEIVRLFKSKVGPHEIGLLLEVSEKLASDAFVPYKRGEGNWSRPDKLFTSGYTLAERKRLIDRLVRTYQAVFGYPLQSVGAWYIDAPTLNYLHDRYGIKAVLTTADQYSTDRYQQWGKYFSTPYYPSRLNTLMPAKTEDNQLDIVIIQWALRDPTRSYGSGVDESTYSLQANDYQGNHGLDIVYFQQLFDIYADKSNPIAQVTIGLETGMESTLYAREFERQLDYVVRKQSLGEIVAVTMAEFALNFQDKFRTNPSYLISSPDLLNEDITAYWWMTPNYRAGLTLEKGKLRLRDLKLYDERFESIDVIYPDNRQMLFRSVPSLIDDVVLANGRILANHVSSASVQRLSKGVRINLSTSQGNKEITLSQTAITVDKKTLFDRDKYNIYEAAEEGKLLKLLKPVQRWTELYQFPPSLLKYSVINGKSYFGIVSGKNSLIGLRLNPFAIGQFGFEYQTIAWFKSFPPYISLRRFYKSHSQLEAEKALKNFNQTNITALPQGTLSLEEIKNREKNGWRRLFENDYLQVWRKS